MNQSQAASPYSARDEKTLMTELWDPQIADNLEAYVMFAFPWGKENTPLWDKKGPRSWQRDELQAITDQIKSNKARMEIGLFPEVYKSATASGRGVGKSSLTAWLTLWNMTCHIGSTTIVTANNEEQLKTRTWAELGTWHTLSINGHWFEKQALHLKPVPWFQEALKNQLKIDSTYYYAHAQLWSEEKPEGFAGIHNPKGLVVIFDEASGIPSPIWTVTDGFFTEPVLHRYQFAFSNPRRNTGPFFECFNLYREFWRTRNLDSRTVEGVDVGVLDAIIRQYGEDSDEARIEVKGQFPRQGDKQFISRSIVDEAATREIEEDYWAPLIMGVDPARFGNDKTVIRFRQGRRANIIPPIKLKGMDNMQVANECAHLIQKYDPDAVCVDAGNGTGIIDRLKEMRYRRIYEVWFGSKSDRPEWADKRTELWARMREWLKGGVIDKDKELLTDLSAPEYYFTKDESIRLESKEELKKRGFASPDDADALACTFFVNVARKDRGRLRGEGHSRMAKDIDYPIFGG